MRRSFVRIASAFALLAAAAGPAGATAKSPAELTTQIATKFADNSQGLITEAVLRATLQDLSDSAASLYYLVTTCATNQWVTGFSSNAAPICSRPSFSSLSGSIQPSQMIGPTDATLGGVYSSAAPSNQFATGILSSGALTYAQPSFSNLSGQIGAAQLIAPGASTFGAVKSSSAPTNQFATGINTSGVVTYAQPTFANIAGSLSPSQAQSLSIDVRTVGMTGDGTTDNAQFISALMTADTPTPNTFTGGYPKVFPGNFGTNVTNYKFNTPFSLSRGGSINCGNAGGPRYNTTNLVFAAGVHGIINETNTTSSDGGVGNADVVGCGIVSLGYGTLSMTGGSTAVTSIAFETGNTGLTAPPFAAGDGIIAVPGFAGGATMTASISGTTLTVTSYSGAKLLPGDYIYDGGVAVGTIITADTGGGGGTGTYTVNISQTVPSSTLTVQWANTQTVVPPGAFIDAASTNTATLNSAFLPDADVIARTQTGTIRFLRLPAARAYTFNSTSGSDTITVTSGPSDSPMMLGDMIWSDAFPFGTIVYAVSGRSYPQTVKFRDASMTATQNATATKTGGKMWVIPAGINRRNSGRARKNYVYGFGIGIQINCSTGSGFGIGGLNCTTSFDQENAYERNLIGRMTSGNNTGASVSIGNEHVAQWMDIVENGSVGSAYYGDNSNSAEAGQAFYAVRVNCQNQNYSYFGGMYVGWQAAPACIDGTRQLTGPNNYDFAGSNITWDTPNAGPGPVDLGQISAAGVRSPSFIFGPGNGNCIKFQARVGVTQLMQFGKDCGTLNNIGLGYNSTLDRWDYTPSAVAGNVPYMTFATFDYARLLSDGYPTAIFPRGVLLGSRLTQTTAGGEKILDAYSAAQVANANHKRGDVRFTTTPSAGGYVGWVCTADTCSSVFPFGPIANDTGGTDWTIPTARSTNLLWSSTAPTISSGFGTGASVSLNNGTAAFRVNVGTGGTASSGVVGLPAAANGWNCFATDITTQSTSVFMTKQTGSTTTTATFTNYNTAGAATAWVASDILAINCSAL